MEVCRVSKEELEKSKVLVREIEAIKFTIDELIKKRGILEGEKSEWWHEIYKKYKLDPNGLYYLEHSTGKVTMGGSK